MKAIGFKAYGEPDVLEEMELSDPVPGKDEVVIRKTYTSINMIDVLVRRGYVKLNITMPHIPGSDIVGRIESIGSNVKWFAKGDLVVANTLFGCGRCEFCLAGNEVMCKEWKVVGRETWGSYAELVKVPASVLIKPPTNISEEELACMPISLSTSWRALKTVGEVKTGETILIRGASGNTGIFATMLAKSMNLKVIAASRGKEKENQLEGIGVDLVVDANNKEEMTKEIMEFTKGGPDLVIESLGSTLNDSIEIVKQGGKVVSFGSRGGSESKVGVLRLYLKSVKVLGTHNANRKEFEDALNYVSQHNIHPIISKTMQLSDAKEANREFEASKLFGKILLKN